MREIKFRVWDEDNNTIGTVLSFTNLEVLRYDLDGIEDYFGRGYFKNNPNYLMQFTGLQDKNGVDIYEGDILEFKNDLGRNAKVKIFYKKGGLCYNCHDDDFKKHPENIIFYESCADMQSKGWITQCEIIGNIHENKDLI